jgi:hypothetical protein
MTVAFLTVWDKINVALGGTPATDLTLHGGYTRADFSAARETLIEKLTALSAADNERTTAAAQRDIAKRAIKAWLAQFRPAVTAALYGSTHAQSLPAIPEFTLNEARYLRPFCDMETRWERINGVTDVDGFTPPLLVGGRTLADFRAELDDLRAKYAAANAATTNEAAARRERDAAAAALKTRMKQFRDAAIARLGLDHALVRSVPVLSPRPGSTPNAVVLTAVWNPETGMADLAWTPSDHPKLHHYSLRRSPDLDYRTEGEQVIAKIPPTETSFSTNAGLVVAGASTALKLYVVTKTGNEKGSNAVVITRP